MAYFDLQSHQRYFHIIAFKTDSTLFDNKFLKKVGLNLISEDEIEQRFSIKHMSTISNIPYYRGEKDYSVNGDNIAPYKYDIIVINLHDTRTTLFCFPFKALTKFFINDLLHKNNILSEGNFVRTDLDNLIKNNHDHTDYLGEDLSYFFSSVNLTLMGDSLVSLIKLEGDKPLDSTLYKSVFKEKIESDKCKLERCSIKCSTSISKNEKIPKTKSSIHIDKFGNYKLYMHSNGKNIITIPLLFEHINELSCLYESPGNPVLKLKEED